MHSKSDPTYPSNVLFKIGVSVWARGARTGVGGGGRDEARSSSRALTLS